MHPRGRSSAQVPPSDPTSAAPVAEAGTDPSRASGHHRNLEEST